MIQAVKAPRLTHRGHRARALFIKVIIIVVMMMVIISGIGINMIWNGVRGAPAT